MTSVDISSITLGISTSNFKLILALFPITGSRAPYPCVVQAVLRNVSSSWSRSFWWLSSQFLPSLDTLSKGMSSMYRPSSHLVFDIGGKIQMAGSILRMILEFVTIYTFSHLEINFRDLEARRKVSSVNSTKFQIWNSTSRACSGHETGTRVKNSLGDLQ